MTEKKPPKTPSEIAEMELLVDVPFEGASPDPQPLRYADLGPDKEWIPQSHGGQESSEAEG